MHKYLFLLGTTHELSYAELEVVLGADGVEVIKQNNAHATCQVENELDSQKYINILGGTVKIAKKISSDIDNPAVEVAKDLMREEGRVIFAIHSHSGENLNGQIKRLLSKEGKSARFVDVKNPLEAAYHQNKDFHEYLVVASDDYSGIYKSQAVQDIANWSKRDFDRPASDPKSGMLPPKVARMMVNLAIPDQKSSTILDPFCGSGTILAEAMMLGHGVVGSDMSSRAILDTQENISWLKEQYDLDSSSHVFKADVAHLSAEDIFHKKIDAVVYEPYMGPSRIQEEKVKDITRGLQKLYKGALKNIGKLIEPGTKVVGIFPQIKVENTVKSTGDLIDSCENFGYTRLAGPISYSRPNSVVIRKIYILEKN